MTDAYRLNHPYDGCVEIFDAEDGERMARVARFMPGPMVSVTAPSITSPGLARAIAESMTIIAESIERGNR